MKSLKKILNLFLYSNIFISICAAAMVAETYLLIRTDINWLYIAFVFVSTMALYNFPMLAASNFLPGQSERHSWVLQHKKLLGSLFAIGAVLSAGLICLFPFRFILSFVPVAGLAFAYFIPQSNLRSIAVLKAGVVALVWTSVTVVFPLLLLNDLDPAFRGEDMTIITQNFLFIFPLCVIFNVRDIEADRKAGVFTFPTLYGIHTTILFCLASLAIFLAVAFYSPVLSDHQEVLLFSGAASAVLILFASEKRSDYYYMLYIDGMILLQAALVFAQS